MTEKEKRPPQERRKAGRPPKTNKRTHCVMVRFTPQEYADFMTDVERSGAKNRAFYIKKRIENSDFRVVVADKNTIEFYHKLQDIKAEVRKIGVNYNQYITILRKNFTEQRAAIMSDQSAKLLGEVLLQTEKSLQLTLQLVHKWLQK